MQIHFNQKLRFKAISLTQILISMLSLIPAMTFAADLDVKAELAQPFVTVNGVVQTKAHAEIMLREQLMHGVADSKELRDGVREVLVSHALMEQEAHKRGLDKEPMVQAQMDLARQNVLAQAWQQKIISETQISDADIQSEYNAQITRLGDKEYLVRHLLVNDEATAKLLIDKLQSGSKIADLAKEYSNDTLTKDRGGLTDWASPVNFQPSVAEAVKKLDKDKYTMQPVKSGLGWHVLQLDDTRVFKAPAIEVLKPQLVQIVARRILEANIKTLRDQAKIQ